MVKQVETCFITLDWIGLDWMSVEEDVNLDLILKRNQMKRNKIRIKNNKTLFVCENIDRREVK